MFSNIIVAVKHPLMRRGVAAVLQESTELNVVSEVANLADLIKSCSESDPRAVVIDSVLLDNQRGITIKELTRRFPLCRFIALWLYEKPTTAQNAYAQFNIIVERTCVDMIRVGILSALASVPDHELIESAIPENKTLTARENEVLENIALGLSTSEIADRLSISARTAELHRYRICKKLGINSTLDLAKFLIRRGLVVL